MMELTNKLSNNFGLSANKKDDENSETEELFRHREPKVKITLFLRKISFRKSVVISVIFVGE